MCAGNIITLLFDNPTSLMSPKFSLAMATKLWLTEASTEANNGSIQILPIFWWVGGLFERRGSWFPPGTAFGPAAAPSALNN